MPVLTVPRPNWFSGSSESLLPGYKAQIDFLFEQLVANHYFRNSWEIWVFLKPDIESFSKSIQSVRQKPMLVGSSEQG